MLIYWELCSPGLVIAGSTGAALVLGGIWAIAQWHPTGVGLSLLMLSASLLAVAIVEVKYRWLAAAAIAVQASSLITLLPPPLAFTPLVAFLCAVATGTTGFALGRIALAGYRTKRALETH
jgi:hypothetical protein